jgi:ribosomal protein S18 acetylase RimI-like enzyme
MTKIVAAHHTTVPHPDAVPPHQSCRSTVCPFHRGHPATVGNSYTVVVTLLAVSVEVPWNDDVVRFTIRPAGVDDAAALGAIQVRAWQSAYRGVMPDDYLDGLRAEERATFWRRLLSGLQPDQHVLVVLSNSHVVGFACFGPAHDAELATDVGELYAINLDPDAWGRGTGRGLLRHATEQLAEAGFSQAVLWVVPENQRARRLYESEHWRDDDLRRHDEVFGVVVPEMRYRRSLAVPAGATPHVSENDIQ